MDVTEAQAVNDLLRWALRLARLDGAPVSDERFCEAALLLARQARRAFSASLGPEQIALPIGHLVESRRLALPSIATDVSVPGVISPSGLLDGAATLAEASQRAREFADWLRGLAGAGYELEGPFVEDCGVYGVHGPAAGWPDPGSAPGPALAPPVGTGKQARTCGPTRKRADGLTKAWPISRPRLSCSG